MRKYIVYFLIVLEIGGGYLGIWAVVLRIKQNMSMPNNYWVLYIPPILIFIYGILAGLALVERRKLGLVLSTIYQVPQVFILLSPLISYRFHSGLLLGLCWSQGKPVLSMDFGSIFVLMLHGFKGPWLIGINPLALILLVFLFFEIRRMSCAEGAH